MIFIKNKNRTRTSSCTTIVSLWDEHSILDETDMKTVTNPNTIPAPAVGTFSENYKFIFIQCLGVEFLFLLQIISTIERMLTQKASVSPGSFLTS